jgi:hypothetical protein
MTDTDKFVEDCFMPFYRRVHEAFRHNHQTWFSLFNSFLLGKKNHIGLRLIEAEKTIGEYTLFLEGAAISHLDSNIFSSEVNTPFGVVRPYIVLEKSAVERMIADEKDFISDPFGTKMKYIRDTTIKFL